MPSYTPNGVPKSYTSPGGSLGYGGFYNPKTPQFYNPKEPYNHKQPSNPKLPNLTPGDPTSPPKPITKQPYPNLKQPVNIPKPPTLAPLKPILPPGGGAIAPGGILPGGGIAAGGAAAGLAAGAALLWGYNFYQLHKLWGLSQPESKPQEDNPIPPTVSGIPYEVSYRVTITYSADRITIEDAKTKVYAPVAGIRFNNSEQDRTYQPEILSRGRYQDPSFPDTPYPDLRWVPGEVGYNGPQPAAVTITGITRLDGGIDPPPQTPPKREIPPPIFNRDPVPDLATPKPPQPQPNRKPELTPNPQKPPIKLEIPNNQPLTFTSPGNQPLIINQIPPRATPDQPKLPEEPTEIKFPRNTPLGQPQPVQVKPPGQQPITFTTPGNTPITLNIPGFQPITVDPRNTSQPIGATPQLLVPGTFTPNPTTPTRPTPAPTDPPTPEPESPDILIPATILATLTPLLQQIVSNTSPSTVAPLVSASVCRTTQPGGCMSNLVNDNTNKINQNLNNTLGNGLNNISNLANLTLLPVINNKLGDQVPGGLSGFLGRLSKSLGVDRALNLISFASNLHNAMMLSASLKITLLEVLSSVGNATGLLQTSEGDNVDLNAVFDQGIEKLLTLLVGEENYAGLKVGLRRHSAIFRAANNVLSNAGNMFSSIGNGIEVIGERTGKIGNALRAAGVVRENAYAAMSENMTVHTNKFMTYQNTVGGVTEILETINEIAESTIEGQQSYTEAIKATTEFKKVLAEGTKEGAKDAENIAIAAEVAKIKENISKDPTGEKETGYLSFLTD